MEPSQIESSKTIDTNKETEQTHLLIFLYRGKQGDRALRNFNREINCHLFENKKAQVICTVTKLASKLYIKSITKTDNQHDFISYLLLKFSFHNQPKYLRF